MHALLKICNEQHAADLMQTTAIQPCFYFRGLWLSDI